MRRSSASGWTWAVALAITLPAFAQEDSAQVVPVGEAPADEAPAAEAAPTEEAPAEETPTEEASAEPLQVYFGADYVVSTLSLSTTLASGTTTDFDSGMYRARVGMRALEAVGLEFHFGVDNSDDEPTSVETKSYYGLFLVPTATVLEVAELGFPVGYAQSTFGSGKADESFGSIAYGIDAELPLRSFGDTLPDLRFTAGWMVYYQKSDARAYGANLGLRYDFSTAANPFSGLGHALGKLWPFGGGEEAPPTE